MKKVLFLFTLMTISLLTFSQIKKQPKPTTSTSQQDIVAQNQVAMDSVVLKYIKRYDTIKVKVTMFVEDHSLTWTDGYQIKTYYIFSKDDIKQIGDPFFIDKNKILIKLGDIQNVTGSNWK